MKGDGGFKIWGTSNIEVEGHWRSCLFTGSSASCSQFYHQGVLALNLFFLAFQLLPLKLTMPGSAGEGDDIADVGHASDEH